MSDISVDSEAKSARERYILVAAMDIMVNEGTWNIYVVAKGRQNDTISVTVSDLGRTILDGSGICTVREHQSLLLIH